MWRPAQNAGSAVISPRACHVHQGSTCQSLDSRICAEGVGGGAGVGGGGGVGGSGVGGGVGGRGAGVGAGGVGPARLPLVAFELFVWGTDPATFR